MLGMMANENRLTVEHVVGALVGRSDGVGCPELAPRHVLLVGGPVAGPVVFLLHEPGKVDRRRRVIDFDIDLVTEFAQTRDRSVDLVGVGAAAPRVRQIPERVTQLLVVGKVL